MSLTDLGLIRPCHSVMSCEALADFLSCCFICKVGVLSGNQARERPRKDSGSSRLPATTRQPAELPSSVQWPHQTWGKSPPRTATSSKPGTVPGALHTPGLVFKGSDIRPAPKVKKPRLRSHPAQTRGSRGLRSAGPSGLQALTRTGSGAPDMPDSQGP